jgi:pimeloyl-ACP methyl ester carboxylesterase
MPTVATRAGSLVYDELGDGPPLVLLAGGAHDRHDWDGIRPALAERHRTIAFDWPGHGDSPVPPAPWVASAPGFADLLEDAIDELGVGPATFMGNSIGGFSSARLAIRRPELVRALVLVDSGGFVPQHVGTKLFCSIMGRPATIRRVYRRFAHQYMRPTTDEDRRIEATATATATSREGSQVTAGLWRSFSSPGHDLRADIAKITAPTLVVWGRKDPVIPLRVGRRITDGIDGAELVVFEAGHVPFATHPQPFLDAVLPFLAQVRAPLP